MIPRVSAETITSMTAAPEFAAPGKDPVPPAPTVEELIEKIRASLQSKCYQGTGHAKSAQESARRKLDQFEEMIDQVPQGFALAATYYKKIPHEDLQKIRKEFDNVDTSKTAVEELNGGIRSHYLKHLAEHFTDDLRQLGICDHGISFMREGFYPISADGMQYSVGVDHIIEAAGCGGWADSKDPDIEGGSPAPHYRANHYANLALIPDQVHLWKNLLNNFQGLTNSRTGEAAWILTLVPATSDPSRPVGFVAPPQQLGHKLSGMQIKADRIHMRAVKLKQTTEHTLRLVNAFTAEKTVARFLKSCEKALNRAPANDNKLGAQLITAAEAETQIRKFLKEELRPALHENMGAISQMFNAASESALKAFNGPRDTRAFLWFRKNLESGDMADLRASIDSLPSREKTSLRALFNEIDERIVDLKETIQKKRREQASAPRL